MLKIDLGFVKCFLLVLSLHSSDLELINMVPLRTERGLFPLRNLKIIFFTWCFHLDFPLTFLIFFFFFSQQFMHRRTEEECLILLKKKKNETRS